MANSEGTLGLVALPLPTEGERGGRGRAGLMVMQSVVPNIAYNLQTKKSLHLFNLTVWEKVKHYCSFKFCHAILARQSGKVNRKISCLALFSL